MDRSAVQGGALVAPAPPAAGGLTASAAPPTRHVGIAFALCAVGMFMISVDQTIVATALIAMQRDLGAELQWATWTVSLYALGQVVIMPIAGKLSDMFGRRTVFLAAVGLFTAASFACGFAQDIQVLIALRAVQAIGGGAVVPAASGMVSDIFVKNRDRALPMLTNIYPIGALVGPIVGGLFVTYWSWRGIFLVNVPIGIVLVVAGLLVLPRGPVRRRERLDLQGIALLAGLLLAAMLGITFLGDTGDVTRPVVWAPLAVAAVLLPLALRHLLRSPRSFIPPRLLLGRQFAIMNAVNFCYGAAAIGFSALVPLYAQERFGIPPLESGTLLTARALGIIALSTFTTLLLRRIGTRIPILVGHGTIALGLVLLFLPAPGGMSQYVWLALGAGVTGLGMGIAAPAANNAILHSAKEHIAGVAGLRGMFRQSGAIAAISVVTAVVAQAPGQGSAFGWSFLVLAAMLVGVTPIVFGVEDHRGTW